MGDNCIKMKKSNIIWYNSRLCSERRPQTKDVVWFSEKVSFHSVALDCGSGFGYYLCSLKCEKIGLDISIRPCNYERKSKVIDQMFAEG